MRRLALALTAVGGLGFAGCAKLDLPPEQPSGCVSSIALDGTGSSQATDVGPVDLGAVDVCMRLDASKNQLSAHLGVSVGEYLDGTKTGFKATLVDLDGVTLRDGWDVQVDTRVFHNLEWSLDAGEVRDVILHVTKTGVPAATPIRVSLFEPFE